MSEASGPPGGPDFTKRDQPAPPPTPPTGPSPSASSPSGPPPYGAPRYDDGTAYGQQRVVPLRPEEERTWGILANAGGFVAGFLAPLIVWLVFRERSAWVDACAKEALNFQITFTIYLIVAAFSIVALIGLLLLPLVFVAYFVLMIVGSVKAASMQPYRFPLILRLVA